MKILKATIEGFKNIKSDSIIFDEKIISLVSTNSYGKSNFMQALDFVFSFIKAVPDSKLELMGDNNLIPLNTKMDSHNFKVDLLLYGNHLNKPIYIKYGFEFEWIKNTGGKKIVGEWLQYKYLDDKKYTTLINRNEKALYKSSESGRCTAVISVSDKELVINRLQLENNLFYSYIVNGINELNVYYDRHLDVSYCYSLDPLISKGNKRFGLDNIDNVPRVIYYLKQNHIDKYELLKNAFMQLFSNIIEIDVREIDIGKYHSIDIPDNLPFTISPKVYSLFVRDKNINQPIDFTSLSDGAKRVFLLLSCLVIADLNNVALVEFEEPENSIHPGLLQGFISVISQLAGNCTVLLASHSPYIIQYINTCAIYVGKPNEDGLAIFSRISKSKEKALLKDSESDNTSVGDYIFDLLSGGEDDVELLMTYLEN